MPISFDDLIPKNEPSQQNGGRVSFDDLIPPPKGGRHLSFEEGQALLDAENQQGGAHGAVTSTLAGIVNGVPVVGPYLLEGEKRAAAGLASLFGGDGYDANLRQVNANVDTAREMHPTANTVGEVAGAVGGTVPMVMAAPGAFGGGSAPLLLRSFASLGSGGALGGADAAVRSGGDLDATKAGALWGAGLGAVAPAVGSAVGKGTRAVIDAVGNRSAAKAAGTNSRAVSDLYRAIVGDGIAPADVGQRLADLGPEGMLMDLGPSLQGQAAGLAAMPGRGQGIVREAIEARQLGANSRIAAAVDQNLGQNVIPSEIQAGISQNQQALTPLYRDAFPSAQRYDLTPIADSLDRDINRLRGGAQQALRRVRGMLNITNTDQLSSDPNVMFQTRQAIDGMLSTEADPKVISALTETRQMLDDGLRASVPRIKEADASFAELARQGEALQRGQQVLDHGRTAPRPPELIDEIVAGAQPQGMQIGPSAVPLRMSQGARAEVDRILGSNANDIAALNRLIKGEGDWNRSRLASLFGQEKADRLFRVLDNERRFADTRQIVTRNSETARRQQSIADLGGAEDPNYVRQAYAAGGAPGVLRAGGVKAADKVLNWMLSGNRDAAGTELANLITSNRGQVVDALSRRARNGAPAPLVEALTRAILLGSPTGAR